MNRQQLPANYLETGAFFISKSNIITENTRIGGKIGIFEISEEEAIDIDNFVDFCHAEFLLSNKNIAIYVNGNNKRGAGHIYRVLEIADEFYVKPDIYYDVNQTDKAVFGTTTHNLIPVNGIGELLHIAQKKSYRIFINDILSTSIDYMIALKIALPKARIVNFEDDGEGAIKADLVFNALYSVSDAPHIKSGEKYYISPKIFMFYEPIIIKEHVRKVFVCFGGADPMNYTELFIDIAKKEKYKNISFVIVLGRAKENIKKILSNKADNITIMYNISNMPVIMSECDIGISSRGRTAYELAMLGIPSVIMAQNKREAKHGFISNENGFSYLGINPGNYVIETTLDMYINMPLTERQYLQNTLLSHDLRSGRKRVMELINGLER